MLVRGRAVKCGMLVPAPELLRVRRGSTGWPLCVIPVKSCMDVAGTFRKENMCLERAKHLKNWGNIMFGKHREGLA